MRFVEYLDKFPRELLETKTGRHLLTRNDPLLFAILYMSHHLRFGNDEPSLSQFHLDLAEFGKSWIQSTNASRDCWIAPRQSGKSTWLFTILPLWAAAHQHLKFIAAFSDSADQATKHLQTFKHELDNNDLLRKDYPLLCKPALAGGVKRYIAQSNQEIQQANGFSFVAKGIDSKSLGLKIGNTRPDLLLLDDIEPNESNYSAHECKKRLRTVLDSVFYLNDKAQIVIVGTTVMSGSIIDQLRKVGELRSEHADMPGDEGIDPHTSLMTTNVNINTDNNDYVNLDKATLTGRYAGNTGSVPFSAQEYADGHPIPDHASSSLSVESGASPELGEPERNGADKARKSNDNEPTGGANNDTQTLHLQRFAKSQLDSDLPSDLTSGNATGNKTDFNSFSSFYRTSIPITYIEQNRNTADRHNAELARLKEPIEPNRGEQHIEITANDSDLSFYDSLDSELKWVIDERIAVHYYPAIIIDKDGNESSWWPEFKPLEELNRIRHTRAFHMNYQNKPVNVDAQFWTENDIEIAEPPAYVRTLLSVDPAVSTKTSNDYTAFVVVSLGSDGLVYVRHAEQMRLVSTDLRDRANELIELFDIGLVYCETNQGGMLWKSVFDGVKAKYKPIHQTEPKTIRAGRALDNYRKNKVRHTRHFDTLEEQMYSFPKVQHDDLVDALGTGIEYFLCGTDRPKVIKRSYI